MDENKKLLLLLLLMLFAASVDANVVGLPFITDVRYERSSRTVICTSSGGPATLVEWSLDESPIIVEEGSTYRSSQIITNTSTATYQNMLQILHEDPDNLYGVYACTVRNAMGTDYSQIRVSGSEMLSN